MLTGAPSRLYYTQFIGDPHNRPIIKGCSKFTGIGLIDTDPYIPGAYVDIQSPLQCFF